MGHMIEMGTEPEPRVSVIPEPPRWGAAVPKTNEERRLQAEILLRLAKMDTDLAVITEKLSTLADHESRIRGLERFKYKIAGLSLFGGMISAIAGYWIGHILH